MENKIIGNRYIIDSLISEGTFGKIYKGFHKRGREPVAIKIDYGPHNITTVNHESRIINYLFNAGVRKIPEIYWFGYTSYEDIAKVPCLVMTLYECSLYDYMMKKSMTIEKLDIIFSVILEIFEKVHKHFVLHRDIKPQNFMVKGGDVFLIDFGLSTFYMNDIGEHYPNRVETTLVGTPKFSSIRILEGHRYSRRDDLIAIGYMYLYMLLKEAPWDKVEDQEDREDREDREDPSINDENIINIMHSVNQQRMNNKKWENFELFLKALELSDKKIGLYLKRVYDLDYMETTDYTL